MAESSLSTAIPTRPWAASAAGSTHGGPEYGRLTTALREFLDQLAGARPDEADISRIADGLQEWNRTLAGTQVSEQDQVFYRRNDLPDRGQCLVPVFEVQEESASEVSGTVTFGRYFLGGGGAVHGGAIGLVFDGALGSFCNSHGRPPSRTAYLNVSFHALAPIDQPLGLRIRIEREEGRKRFLVGELLHGDVVSARCEGLWIALRDHQV